MKSRVFSPRLVYHCRRQINRAVNFKALTERRFFRPALGAVLTVLCGLILGLTPLGDAWVNSSYDYLFRFGARAVTNKVALIQMDNDAYDYFHQLREQPWDRMLHAQLLQRLATDGCSLVVFDSFFRTPRDPAKDQALADAMRRQHRVVLMAE
jgi:CHASE2 domain-containing sensor protein